MLWEALYFYLGAVFVHIRHQLLVVTIAFPPRTATIEVHAVGAATLAGFATVRL